MGKATATGSGVAPRRRSKPHVGATLKSGASSDGARLMDDDLRSRQNEAKAVRGVQTEDSSLGKHAREDWNQSDTGDAINGRSSNTSDPRCRGAPPFADRLPLCPARGTPTPLVERMIGIPGDAHQCEQEKAGATGSSNSAETKLIISLPPVEAVIRRSVGVGGVSQLILLPKIRVVVACIIVRTRIR